MADLISAIASLLWPLLVIVVLLVFGRQLLSKLRNSDDVTLEIGGQRLNFKQATDQQSDMIADLQREVAVLKRRLERISFDARPSDRTDASESRSVVDDDYQDGAADEDRQGSADVGADEIWSMLDEQERRISVPQAHDWAGSVATGTTASRSILWVDDHPENNAMLAESWRREGAFVELARSTNEALRLLGERPYGLIISDLGRREADVDVPDAGLRLLTQVRAADLVTPFVLYGNVGPYAADARAAGVTLVTGSTFELVEYVGGLGMLGGA